MNGGLYCHDDPCEFAWLIRDRKLSSVIESGAVCSNGTLLHQLNPEGYGNCPVGLCILKRPVFRLFYNKDNFAKRKEPQ